MKASPGNLCIVTEPQQFKGRLQFDIFKVKNKKEIMELCSINLEVLKF